MMKILKSNLFGLLFLFSLYIILISVTNHFILTLNFFDNSGEYFSGIPDREASIFETVQQYIYLTAIIYTTVKLLVVALILYTALFLSGNDTKFSQCFNIAINAEYIFLFAAALKIIWFKIEYPAGMLSDWHKTYVFSMLSLFNNVSADWYYPLQTLNLFEVAYWSLLALGIHKNTSLSYDDSLRTVAASYIPALIIWVVIITFCSIMLSPTTA